MAKLHQLWCLTKIVRQHQRTVDVYQRNGSRIFWIAWNW